MKRFLLIFLAMLMLVPFAACMKDPAEQVADDLVNDILDDVLGNDDKPNVSGSYDGNYVFNPPTDNYHIVYEGGYMEEARVGNLYSYIDNEDPTYSYHVNYERETVYFPYTETEWMVNSDVSWDEYEEDKESPPRMFNAMEEYFIKYLRAFGAEDDELGEELREYYTGDETVCGVKCWVFDSDGVNAQYCKFWIDPSNGAVLKYHWYQDDEEPIALETYDINYTEMDQSFYPEDYDAIDE